MRFSYQLIFLIFFFVMAFTAIQAQTDSVVQRIFLVGDAGEIKTDRHLTLDLLRSLFPIDDKRNTVIYLGDNIYPSGLPDAFAPATGAAAAVTAIATRANPTTIRPDTRDPWP